MNGFRVLEKEDHEGGGGKRETGERLLERQLK